MPKLHQFAIAHPRATIVVAVLCTLSVTPGFLRLRLRTDGHALAPVDSPAVAIDERVRNRFGLDDPVAIVVHANNPNGLFNATTVALIDELTRRLQRLEGVRPERVFSLATEASDRVWPGTLQFRKLLEPLPKTPPELTQLRDDLRAIQLYNGTLISRDQRSAAILVGASTGQDRLDLLQRIHETIGGLPPMNETIDVIGAPVAEALLGTHILEDLGVPPGLLGFRTFDEEPPTAGLEQPGGADAFSAVSQWISRRIGLAPVAMVVIGLIFLACFRGLLASALPLLEVGAAIVFVFGLMGLLGVPIYLTTAVLPIILTATGITDEIHVFSRYRQMLREHPDRDHVELVRETMDELAGPIVMTSMTTGIAFLSFAFSTLRPVQAFGVFTGVGGLFCMVWSLTVVPACFVLLSPRHFAAGRQRVQAGPGPAGRLFWAIGRGMVRFRVAALVAAAGVVAIAPFCVRRLIVQDSWIDGFARSSSFYRATQHFNEQFLGMHVLLLEVDGGSDRVVTGEVRAADLAMTQVVLPAGVGLAAESLSGWRIKLDRLTPAIADSGPQYLRRRAAETWTSWVESAGIEGGRLKLRLESGRPSAVHLLQLRPDESVRFELSPAPFMQPGFLEQIGGLERFVAGRTSDAVGGVLGLTDYVSTVNFMIFGRKADQRRIPPDRRHVERAWREYAGIRGEERVGQLVDATFTSGVITVLLKNANFVDTARLMGAIRGYESQTLSAGSVSIDFAGDVAVSQSLIEAIVGTEIRSLAGTMVGVLVVTILLGRSLLFGLVCVLPSTLAVLMNFAAMGLAGIPLGVATSMFSAMTIGIGVDYAIHLQSRVRRAAGRQGAAEPIAAALAAVGPAIFIDTLAVALGFGILLLSQVPANARLGALVALSIVSCFLVTVVVLPAILSYKFRHRSPDVMLVSA